MDEFDNISLTDNSDVDMEIQHPTSLERKLAMKTDTSDYDSTEFEIMSPEEAELESKRLKKGQRFANEDFGKAVDNIEKKLGREINADEYDKLCRSYATVLCEEDAKILKTGHISKITRQEYYDQLIENKPIVRAAKSFYEKEEDALIADITKELDRVKSIPVGELEVKSGRPINFNHKGKVKVSEDSNGLIYRFDNEKDVKLLNMKNRQEWIEKRFPDEIAQSKGEINENHNADGFE